MPIVNPVLSVVDVVRQSEWNLQYKNHQTHNFLLLLDISRPEW